MNDRNLENLKIGDTVVSVRLKGNKVQYGYPRIVREFDEHYKVWRYANLNKPDKNCGSFPVHGGCKDFMSRRDTYDFYFSANPVHIQRAKMQAKRAEVQRLHKEAYDKARLEEFEEKLNILLTEYGASIYPSQTHGDDQGVEIDMVISINGASKRCFDGI